VSNNSIIIIATYINSTFKSKSIPGESERVLGEVSAGRDPNQGGANTIKTDIDLSIYTQNLSFAQIYFYPQDPQVQNLTNPSGSTICQPVVTNINGTAVCRLQYLKLQSGTLIPFPNYTRCLQIELIYYGNKSIKPATALITACPQHAYGTSGFGQAIQEVFNQAANRLVCLPVLIVAGLLISSMYYMGKNPLSLFDITTPRVPQGRKLRAVTRIVTPFHLMKSTRSAREYVRRATKSIEYQWADWAELNDKLKKDEIRKILESKKTADQKRKEIDSKLSSWGFAQGAIESMRRRINYMINLHEQLAIGQNESNAIRLARGGGAPSSWFAGKVRGLQEWAYDKHWNIMGREFYLSRVPMVGTALDLWGSFLSVSGGARSLRRDTRKAMFAELISGADAVSEKIGKPFGLVEKSTKLYERYVAQKDNLGNNVKVSRHEAYWHNGKGIKSILMAPLVFIGPRAMSKFFFDPAAKAENIMLAHFHDPLDAWAKQGLDLSEKMTERARIEIVKAILTDKYWEKIKGKEHLIGNLDDLTNQIDASLAEMQSKIDRKEASKKGKSASEKEAIDREIQKIAKTYDAQARAMVDDIVKKLTPIQNTPDTELLNEAHVLLAVSRFMQAKDTTTGKEKTYAQYEGHLNELLRAAEAAGLKTASGGTFAAADFKKDANHRHLMNDLRDILNHRYALSIVFNDREEYKYGTVAGNEEMKKVLRPFAREFDSNGRLVHSYMTMETILQETEWFKNKAENGAKAYREWVLTNGGTTGEHWSKAYRYMGQDMLVGALYDTLVAHADDPAGIKDAKGNKPYKLLSGNETSEEILEKAKDMWGKREVYWNGKDLKKSLLDEVNVRAAQYLAEEEMVRFLKLVNQEGTHPLLERDRVGKVVKGYEDYLSYLKNIRLASLEEGSLLRNIADYEARIAEIKSLLKGGAALDTFLLGQIAEKLDSPEHRSKGVALSQRLLGIGATGPLPSDVKGYRALIARLQADATNDSLALRASPNDAALKRSFLLRNGIIEDLNKLVGKGAIAIYEKGWKGQIHSSNDTIRNIQRMIKNDEHGKVQKEIEMLEAGTTSAALLQLRAGKFFEAVSGQVKTIEMLAEVSGIHDYAHTNYRDILERMQKGQLRDALTFAGTEEWVFRNIKSSTAESRMLPTEVLDDYKLLKYQDQKFELGKRSGMRKQLDGLSFEYNVRLHEAYLISRIVDGYRQNMHRDFHEAYDYNSGIFETLKMYAQKGIFGNEIKVESNPKWYSELMKRGFRYNDLFESVWFGTGNDTMVPYARFIHKVSSSELGTIARELEHADKAKLTKGARDGIAELHRNGKAGDEIKVVARKEGTGERIEYTVRKKRNGELAVFKTLNVYYSPADWCMNEVKEYMNPKYRRAVERDAEGNETKSRMIEFYDVKKKVSLFEINKGIESGAIKMQNGELRNERGEIIGRYKDANMAEFAKHGWLPGNPYESGSKEIKRTYQAMFQEAEIAVGPVRDQMMRVARDNLRLRLIDEDAVADGQRRAFPLRGKPKTYQFGPAGYVADIEAKMRDREGIPLPREARYAYPNSFKVFHGYLERLVTRGSAPSMERLQNWYSSQALARQALWEFRNRAFLMDNENAIVSQELQDLRMVQGKMGKWTDVVNEVSTSARKLAFLGGKEHLAGKIKDAESELSRVNGELSLPALSAVRRSVLLADADRLNKTLSAYNELLEKMPPSRQKLSSLKIGDVDKLINDAADAISRRNSMREYMPLLTQQEREMNKLYRSTRSAKVDAAAYDMQALYDVFYYWNDMSAMRDWRRSHSGFVSPSTQVGYQSTQLVYEPPNIPFGSRLMSSDWANVWGVKPSYWIQMGFITHVRTALSFFSQYPVTADSDLEAGGRLSKPRYWEGLRSLLSPFKGFDNYQRLRLPHIHNVKDYFKYWVRDEFGRFRLLMDPNMGGRLLTPFTFLYDYPHGIGGGMSEIDDFFLHREKLNYARRISEKAFEPEAAMHFRNLRLPRSMQGYKQMRHELDKELYGGTSMDQFDRWYSWSSLYSATQRAGVIQGAHGVRTRKPYLYMGMWKTAFSVQPPGMFYWLPVSRQDLFRPEIFAGGTLEPALASYLSRRGAPVMSSNPRWDTFDEMARGDILRRNLPGEFLSHIRWSEIRAFGTKQYHWTKMSAPAGLGLDKLDDKMMGWEPDTWVPKTGKAVVKALLSPTMPSNLAFGWPMSPLFGMWAFNYDYIYQRGLKGGLYEGGKQLFVKTHLHKLLLTSAQADAIEHSVSSHERKPWLNSYTCALCGASTSRNMLHYCSALGRTARYSGPSTHTPPGTTP
jgi:hypothetical protein